MSTPPLIGIRGITRQFPGVLAVDDVSFELKQGEIVGLVGPNGAGKSTLIKILAGAVAPSAGEIEVDGEAVHFDVPEEATKAGLSFVHQELADVPNLTVAENVFLGLHFPRRFGIFASQRRLRAMTREVLETLECEIDPAATVGSLTVAERRLVMIARGLATRAKLLVLDEPTASLTSDEIAHLFGVIRRSAARGTAIVYVSHRLEEIFELTERVVVMRRGKVVADVATADLAPGRLVEHIVGHKIQPGARPAPAPSTTGPPLLKVEGLTRAGAVEEISFDLHAGEVLGIAGLLGSGRTELARLIAGADRATAGKVCLEGRELDLRSTRRALAEGIVLLPEDRRNQGLVMEFNIRSNVTLPILSRVRRAPRLPVPSKAAERRVAGELRERLSIQSTGVEMPVRLLSGGNQQKVVLAKWLAHGAKVFLFDEPTHGVDVAGKAELYEQILALAGQGHGVIFISSEFLEIEEVCGRSLVLREGRIAADLHGTEVNVSNLTRWCYSSGAGEQTVTAGASASSNEQ